MSFLKSVRDYYGEPKPERPIAAVGATNGAGQGYAAAALAAEVRAVEDAVQGTRNATLNTAAYNLGQLVAGGHLDYHEVAEALDQAGTRAGLGDDEIGPTLRSGLTAGAKNPRNIPAPRTQEVTSWAVGSAGSAGTNGSDTPTTTTGASTPSSNAGDAAESDTPDPEDLAAAVHHHLPRLDWHHLWADDTEEEWVIEPILPARRLVALYSAPKIGKSLLLLELAAAIATGRPVLGTTLDRARRVLYVDFENDPLGDIRTRLVAMGYGPHQLDNLVYLSFPTLAALDSEKGSRELMAAVEVYGCEVVVIDTISRAVEGEENENDTWLDFYRHTGLKMKQAGVSMIRLDHTGKDESKGQRGGSAKVGDVDAVWKMSRISEDTFRLELTDQRMPIAEKLIVLTRKLTPHLHHQVAGEPRAAAIEASVKAVLDLCDSLDLPKDTGRDVVRKHLKSTGIRASNQALSEAIKRRSGPVRGVWGQVPENDLSADGRGQVRTGSQE